MQSIGELIRSLRENKAFPLRKVAAYLDIDQAILSKIERGQRKLSKEQVSKLAKFFDYDEKEMMIIFLSDRIVNEIEDEDYAMEALKFAEEKIAYLSKSQLSRKDITSKIRKYFKKDPRVKKAWIFGSFARAEDEPSSDIDMMLEFCKNQSISLYDLEDIKNNLENLLHRKIDIVEKGFIKAFAWETAKPDLQLIYE